MKHKYITKKQLSEYLAKRRYYYRNIFIFTVLSLVGAYGIGTTINLLEILNPSPGNILENLGYATLAGLLLISTIFTIGGLMALVCKYEDGVPEL